MEKLDNRFYTRVLVDKYAILAVIDDFNCNLISTYAVEKLGLSVVDHPCPYEIMRYNQLISVTKQVWLSFSLGTYKDLVLCDVVDMDDCHVHLGNPWQRYRNVVHNPVKNSYHVCMERNHILVPMSKEEAQRSVNGLQDRVRNWSYEKKDVIEEEACSVISSGSIDAGDEVVEKDDVDVSCVLELEIKDHETKVVVEEIDERFELRKAEPHVIEFEESEEVQVMDALDPIDEEVELHDLNDHSWIFKVKIDRSHDEWYESMGEHWSIKMEYWVEDMKNSLSDSERLWELLFQRGFREREERHEPSSTGHVYLTFFQFSRLTFDPGGHLFRFEVESSSIGRE